MGLTPGVYAATCAGLESLVGMANIEGLGFQGL